MDVDAATESAAVDRKGKGKAKVAPSGKRFEIKKWNAVAMWSWAICTDTCAICRNNLYEPSIEYQVSQATLLCCSAVPAVPGSGGLEGPAGFLVWGSEASCRAKPSA